MARTKPPADHYLIYTRSNMERTATFDLRTKGASVYFPQIIKRRSHAGKQDWVAYPLFPRYIFVLCSSVESVHLLRTARGVSDVLKREEGPVIVRRDVIDGLRALESKNGYIKLSPTVKGGDQFRRGEAVIIEGHGVLDGMLATFGSLTSRERAQIALQAFGGRPVEIDLKYLERVASRHVA